MDYYQLWVDLKDSHRDLEFVANVQNYLGHLKEKGFLESFTVTRRKLGLGPSTFGEFNVTISTKDLAQLDRMFLYVATRGGAIEPLHRAVYGMVTNFSAALYRDFPDPGREMPKK
jgi:uncharacterized protein DUF6614